MINLAEIPPDKIRLMIVTAIYGRPTLTEKVLRYYAELDLDGFELDLVAVRSPEDEEPTPDVDGWRYIEAPNLPLGAKWNTVLPEFEKSKAEALMIVGSDDLVSRSYFDLAYGALRKGANVVASHDLCIYRDDTVYLCEASRPGAGKILDRRTITELGGALFDAAINRFLDSSLIHRLLQVRGVSYYTARMNRDRSYAILDVKTGGRNMWSLKGPEKNGGMFLVNEEDGHSLRIARTSIIPTATFFSDYFPTVNASDLW